MFVRQRECEGLILARGDNHTHKHQELQRSRTLKSSVSEACWPFGVLESHSTWFYRLPFEKYSDHNLCVRFMISVGSAISLISAEETNPAH